MVVRAHGKRVRRGCLARWSRRMDGLLAAYMLGGGSLRRLGIQGWGCCEVLPVWLMAWFVGDSQKAVGKAM